jgi:hypothetical protein
MRQMRQMRQLEILPRRNPIKRTHRVPAQYMMLHPPRAPFVSTWAAHCFSRSSLSVYTGRMNGRFPLGCNLVLLHDTVK